MLREIAAYHSESLHLMRADLRALVECESPSDDPAALARCGRLMGELASERIDARVDSIDDPAGPLLDIRVGALEYPPVLLLGHLDTVWPCGTLAARPYRDDGDIARGPGVFDMKAGLIQGLWAVRALKAIGRPSTAVRLIVNSDEEIQSKRSRPYLEDAARHARVVLVLEPSLDGALKTSRKGVGRFSVEIRGRAAHAGIDPRAGLSAIAELAHVIELAHAITDHDIGTTVNVGVVTGGSRPNVVAEEARAVIDVRVPNASEAARVTATLRGMSARIAGIVVKVSGEIVRPPMPRTPAIAGLFELARSIAAHLGVDLHEGATGGASDANFCAALGVPVLDGLGAVGGGAHAANEFVSVSDMPARAALVAGLIDACSFVPPDR